MSWDAIRDALKASIAIRLGELLSFDAATAETLIAWDTEPDSSAELIVRLSVVSDIDEGDRVPEIAPVTFALTEVREAVASVQVYVESGIGGQALSVARSLAFWLGRRDTRETLAVAGVALEGRPGQTRSTPFMRDGYQIGAAIFETRIRYRETEATGETQDVATGLTLQGKMDGSTVFDEQIGGA